MKPSDRQQQILDRLRAAQQEWKIDDLARSMRVSPLTIRRDLDVLSASGTIVRTSGGCLSVTRVSNPEYQRRVATNFESKAAIGKAATAWIKPRDRVVISDGSTTFHMAAQLGQCGPMTVYTNSLAMIGEFSRFPNVELHIVGGRYDPGMFVLTGSLMERVLETLDTDTTFLGTDAIDADGRLLAVDHDMARVMQLMMRCSRRNVLLADATKISARSAVVFGTLRDFDVWITSRGVPPALLRKYRRLVKVQEV